MLSLAAVTAQAQSEAWPPALPGFEEGGTVTLEGDAFLAVPGEVTERAAEDCAAPFVVAEVAPRVELAFHGELPHDGQNSTGWSSWGDIGVASNGRVYSGIGDHGGDAAGTANAYIYEWDPETSTLEQVVDINAIGEREGGEPSWSKVHARIDEGPDDRIYFSGTLNDGNRASQEQFKWTDALTGGQLYRYDPETGEAEAVVSLPPARATATSLLDRENNRWWCNLEAGEGNTLYAIDLETGEPVFEGEDGIVTQNRNFALTSDGVAIFNGEGGLWKADPETGTVTPTGVDPGAMRASTRESSDGHIYGVTYRPGKLFRYTPATDELEMLGPDFLCGDYTTVIVLSPDERYLYYLPGAHGGAREIGTPVVQYDIATGERKVLAFLRDPIREQHDYTPAGTYGIKLSSDGQTLYANLNGHAADEYRPEQLRDNGFGLTSFLAVHIPEEERSEPE